MPKDTMFTNYLFRLRRIRGYSQKQLAMLLGLRARKAISEFEQGRRLPGLQTAILLEIVLGTRLREIYPGLYDSSGIAAVRREGALPRRFSRHIAGRVLGKD
jgi:transcriptional regulator with XRE-family HTH domain